MRERRITIFAADVTLMPLQSTRDKQQIILGPHVETTRLDILDGIATFREHDILVVGKLCRFIESESDDDDLGEEFRGRWCRGSNAPSGCRRSGCG